MWTEFWTFFDPLPPLWTILLNRAYVLIWTFGKPPSPCHVHMVYECPQMKMLVLVCPKDNCLKKLHTLPRGSFIFPCVILGRNPVGDISAIELLWHFGVTVRARLITLILYKYCTLYRGLCSHPFSFF